MIQLIGALLGVALLWSVYVASGGQFDKGVVLGLFVLLSPLAAIMGLLLGQMLCVGGRTR